MNSTYDMYNNNIEDESYIDENWNVPQIDSPVVKSDLSEVLGNLTFKYIFEIINLYIYKYGVFIQLNIYIF